MLVSEKKVKIGVIPAAGSGNRIGYLTKLIPKTMLPLRNKPIVRYVIDQMQDLGVEDIYIIVNVHSEKIKDYIRSVKQEIRPNIHYIFQKRLNGSGESIYLAKKYIKNQPFMVIFGDDCTISPSLQDMVASFFKSDAVAMQGMVKENNIEILKNTCCAKLAKDGRIIDIIEKPKNPPYKIRGCSVFLFRPEIFASIKGTKFNKLRGEKDIVYSIKNLIKTNKAYGFTLKGHNININDMNQLWRANVLLEKYKTKQAVS